MSDSPSPKAIEALADFFSGAAVAHNSICLSLGGIHKTMAERFFDCRQALGLRYYERREEAVEIIKRTLTQP